ncbi:MAG: dUTP diphosphatase, partial [Bacteroidia bacterium]
KDYNDDLAVKRVQMELVDVWHFVMTLKIESSLKYTGFNEEALIHYFNEFDNDYARPEALSTIDKIYRLMTNPNSLSYFCDACISCGLDFDDLYLLYLAKNTLNKFRQDNAYRAKDGVEYVKMWGEGLEDNDYLFELAEGMKRCVSLPKPDEIKALFYDALQAKYDDVLSARNG